MCRNSIAARFDENELKRLTEDRRKWLARHTVLSGARTYLSRTRRQVRIALGLKVSEFSDGRWVSVYSNGRTQKAHLLGKPRPVPSMLCLSRNYEQTASFLIDLRNGMFETYRRNKFQGPRSRYHRRASGKAAIAVKDYWDFSQIKEISPEVALVIAAEYNRFHRGGSWVPKAIDIERWQPGVREMLTAVGFLSLAGTDPPDGDVLTGSGWSILKFRAGRQADGEQVKNLLRDLGVAEMLDNAPLYEAIMEGLVNTIHHAYPGSHAFEEPHIPGWWMTGIIDKEQRWFSIIIYDQGLSIPATLPAWRLFPAFSRKWTRLFSSAPDSETTSRDGVAIRLAMKVGKTQTNEATRGKGLHAIEAAVNLCADGELAIYSRCGEYRKETGRSGRHVNRNNSIGGTLIVWNMSFGS